MMNRKIPFEIKMLDNMLSRKICENIKKEDIFNISHVQADILGYLYLLLFEYILILILFYVDLSYLLVLVY